MMMLRRTVRRLVLAACMGVGLASAGVAALADAPKAGHAPDPPARPNRKQWVFDIKAIQGQPHVDSVKAIRLESPRSTARVMGRYALELYVGRELLDRIRFNVPLTGDGPTPKEDKRPFKRPSFERVNVRIRVRMADNPRATYALLVDRATGKTEKLPWPPDAEAPAKAKGPDPEPKRDGGAPSPDAAPPKADAKPPKADAKPPTESRSPYDSP